MFATTKKTLALILFLAILIPPLSLAITPAPPTQAFFGDSFDGSNMMGGAGTCIVGFLTSVVVGALAAKAAAFIDPTAVPSGESNAFTLADAFGTFYATFSDLVKECIVDPMMWYIKQALIGELTASVLGWISTGFLGGPAFVQDPIAFFDEMARWGVDRFFAENWDLLNDLACEPFVQINIGLIYDRYLTPPYNPTANGGGGRAQCTHAEAGIDWNIYVEQGDGFGVEVNGEMMGLSNAFAINADANNPVGSFFQMSSEMNTRVSGALASEASLLSYGDGFHPGLCDTDDGDRTVCTPGQFIVNQLDDWVGGALAQLEVADELSEDVSASIAGLTNNILTSGLPSFGFGGANANAVSIEAAKSQSMADGIRAAATAERERAE